MRTLTFFDRTLLFLAVALFVFAAYLVWDDSLLFGPKDIGTGLAVGEVKIMKNDVRRKSKRNFSWGALEPKAPLFSGDSLFTGKSSELELTLNDGTAMTISENTLIVLEKSSSTLNLDLKYGEVDRIENSQNKIVLNQGGERSEFLGSQKAILSIKSKEGKAVLKVISGEVKVKNKAGESKIIAGKDDKIQLEKPIAKVTKPPKLISPFNNAIYLPESTRLLVPDGTVINLPLEFKWESNSEGSVFLQIAKDQDFKEVVFKKELLDSFYVLEREILPLGKYFWRVGSISDVGRTVLNSPSFGLSLEKDPQLTLTYPPQQSLAWMSKARRLQKFAWAGNELIKSYDLEVAKDSEFKTIVFQQSTNKGSAEWIAPEFGKFYWRVRTALSQSRAQEFSLLENKNPVAQFPPANSTLITKDFKLILPEEKLEAVTAKPVGTSFEFKWESSEFAECVLELSSAPDFKEIKWQKKFAASPARVTDLPPGNFFWRVRGEDSRHSENLASLSFAITILPEIIKTKVDAPTLSDADKRFEMRPLPGRTPSSLGKWFQPYDLSGRNRPFLEWKSMGEKAAYTLVISKDKDAKNVVLKKDVSDNTFRWEDMKPGFYYWAVNAKESTLTKEGSKSFGTLKVTVPPPSPEPVALKKEKVLTEDQMKAPSPKANLKWNKTPLAENYKIEIANEKTFAKSKRFKSNDEKLSHNISGSGTYYWRVTALDKNGEEISEPGQAGEFSFSRDFGLYTPVIASPKFDSSMVFLSKKASHLVLGWQKVDGAIQYEFELSLDDSFKSSYYKGKSKAVKEYLPIELPAGKNFWRIRAINEKYQSEWSEPNPFVVSYGK